jgi:hypothetical protein
MTTRFTLLLGFGLLLAPLTARSDDDRDDHHRRIRHVLLLSIDGFHGVDLENWVNDHPHSTLAGLARRGVTFDEARTSTPSDSFPGLVSIVTGGSPRVTGVYYDDSYDRTLFAPGTGCVGDPGTEVIYDETRDFDTDQLFSGGIDPAKLPLRKDASGCHPVFPHQFLAVNTIFEVVRQAGLHTAWSDKHPTYDIVNGPSGQGVEDLYTPEINSLISNGGVVNGVDLAGSKAKCDGTNSLPPAKVQVYTDCIPSQEAYDDVKVAAILHQIAGKKSDGSSWPGGTRVPAVFGMNFQAVSVGQKLPIGGYQDAVGDPKATLEGAIAHTDASIGRMVDALDDQGLLDSTAIVVTAKHGQSPIDFTRLAMEGGGHAPVQTVKDPLDFINLADPSINNVTGPNGEVTSGFFKTDDVGVLWLKNQASTERDAVLAQLTGNAAAIFANVNPPATIFEQNITSGAELAKIYGDPTSSDPLAHARAPNIFIQPNAGVIYSGSSKKIAEHGGGTVDDTNVALLVAVPGGERRSIHRKVSTRQIAPTIVRLLGLDPRKLDAVREEHTPVLPGIFED